VVPRVTPSKALNSSVHVTHLNSNVRNKLFSTTHTADDMPFSLKINATCSVQSVINMAHTATHPATSCLQNVRTTVPTNCIFKTDKDAARTATRALFIHQRSRWNFGTAKPTVFTTLQCPAVQLSSKERDYLLPLTPSLPHTLRCAIS
jgi:hypothetical protein